MDLKLRGKAALVTGSSRAAETFLSKAVLVGVFTSSLILALLTVRILDFPFESALQLSSRDFSETLKKIDHLIPAAQPQGSKAPE